VLILQSTEDHVVPPSNAEFISSKISSADHSLILLKNSYHVATLDNDKDFIVEKALDFITKH
jgi:carboxylesterase